MTPWTDLIRTSDLGAFASESSLLSIFERGKKNEEPPLPLPPRPSSVSKEDPSLPRIIPHGGSPLPTKSLSLQARETRTPL